MNKSASRWFTPTSEFQITPDLFRTPFEDMFFIPERRFADERGSYAELSRIPELDTQLETPFVVAQVNHARSLTKVARGIHAENWRKLVTVISGSCFCALVDLRPEKPSFGQVIYLQLGDGSNDTHGSLFIPAGIGNSLCVTAGPLDYLYCVDQLYSQRDKAGDVALALFDEQLAIEWPFPQEELIISERDRNAVTFQAKFVTPSISTP